MLVVGTLVFVSNGQRSALAIDRNDTSDLLLIGGLDFSSAGVYLLVFVEGQLVPVQVDRRIHVTLDDQGFVQFDIAVQVVVVGVFLAFAVPVCQQRAISANVGLLIKRDRSREGRRRQQGYGQDTGECPCK